MQITRKNYLEVWPEGASEYISRHSQEREAVERALKLGPGAHEIRIGGGLYLEVQTDASEQGSTPQFLYTTEPDYVNAQPLDGATVPETIWVWYAGESREFALDGESVGEFAPVPLWSGELPAGDHVFSDGQQEANFVVDVTVGSLGAGTLSFDSADYEVNTGESVTILVNRLGGNQGEISFDVVSTGLTTSISQSYVFTDGDSVAKSIIYSPGQIGAEVGSVSITNIVKDDRLSRPGTSVITASVTVSTQVTTQDNYFFAANGSPSNTGATQGDPLDIGSYPPSGLQPGDTVHFNGGDTFSTDLTNTTSGTSADVIEFTSYGVGTAQVRSFTNEGDWVRVSNLLFDGEKTAVRPLRIRNCSNVEAVDVTCQNATRNGLELTNTDSVTITNYTGSYFLRDSYTGEGSTNPDAHGISCVNAGNTVINGTSNISYCSGDSLQADPDRAGTNSITISGGPHIWWTGPLPADFNSGWTTGTVPGENAIDTKVATGTRMTLSIDNLECYGWTGGLTNMAALNIKEGVDMTANRLRLRDNDIALRLRGGSDNADITVTNAIIYGNDRALRVEDSLDSLKIYGSTFGDNNTAVVEEAGGGFGSGTDVQGNAFIDGVPSQFSTSTNTSFVAADVVSTTTPDYRPFENTTFIDGAPQIAALTTDFAGVARDTTPNYGAYEAEVPLSATGDNAYYELLLLEPSIRGWADLRSAASIDEHLNAVPTNPNRPADQFKTVYDATEDAAAFRTSSNGNYSVNTREQVRVGNRNDWQNGGIQQSSSTSAFFFWEFKYPQVWVNNSPSTYKHFQLSNNDTDLQFEPRCRFSLADDPTKVGQLDTRIYGSNRQGNMEFGSTGSDSSLLESAEIEIPPDEWIRNWYFLDFANDEVTAWASFTGQAPLKFHDAAFLNFDAIYGSGRDWSTFWFEYNTSSTNTPPSIQEVFGKNFVVMRNLSLGQAQALVDQGSLA